MKKRRLISLVAVLALVAVACGPDEAATTTTTPGATTTTGAAATTTTAPEGIQYDIGVTEAPCDDAVNEGNGCIYLGIISDLTTGPFAPLGVPLTSAQIHFWEAVNEDGGLDGFDVIIREEDIYDAFYTPEETAAGYEAIGDRVLMLAQSLGTPQTQAIISRLAEDNTVAAPATWWSGWSFPEYDGGGLILESGASYCFEAMNGMAFMSQALPEGFTWALIRFPGDYGGDYGAGALIAASQLGLGDPVFDHLQIQFAAGGTPDDAVGLILQHTPTLIVMVTGPTEMATIAGGAFQGGHQQFQILGASPTWNVALTQSPAMPLLEGVYKGTIPWAPWETDTPGHAAMRAAAEANGQGPNGAYVGGWTWQYPVKALLEAAIASGDLTKANLAALAAELSGVDYQGILPTRDFGGDPAENAVRSSMVVQADAEAVDGVSVISPDGAFVSPIAEAFPYEGPCFTN